MTQRAELVACLEALLRLLESRCQDLGDSPFVSSQQLVGEVSTSLWWFRRGRFPKLWALGLLLGPSGPVAKIAQRNGWAAEFQVLQGRFERAAHALNRVRYRASELPVELGDHVIVRYFFRRKAARVTYLPGVSKPSAEIDFDGLFRVGVQVSDGPFVAVHVDPETLEVKDDMAFVRRDPAAIPAPPPNEELRR